MNDSARNNRVVVGVLDVEGVIAIPEARAIELAAIHRALATASTWGELCSVLSERSWGAYAIDGRVTFEGCRL